MALEKYDDTTAIERVKQDDLVVTYTIKDLLLEKANLITAINDVNAQFTNQVTNLKSRIEEVDKKLVEMEKLEIKVAWDLVVEPLNDTREL